MGLIGEGRIRESGLSKLFSIFCSLFVKTNATDIKNEVKRKILTLDQMKFVVTK